VPHRPRKRFSQNFLIDDGVIDAIVRAVAPNPSDLMVEVGPGFGALTGPLAEIVRPLHVVEIDRDIVARLRTAFPPGSLVIHEGDALEFDFAALGQRLRIVGNLPYHISTPLLFQFARITQLRDVHIMLQSEVVERMVAAPASSEYGRLSVMLQYRFEMEKVLDVPADAFRPAPKVESAVIRMIPRAAPASRARDEQLFEETVKTAFSQRRKTLRNTLGSILAPSDFAALDIDPQARAQTLSVGDFVKIADYRALQAKGDSAMGREPKEER
jgi:16S rRNA (adenine1518-N6/adenine1519-N6)-dimethyltransferase